MQIVKTLRPSSRSYPGGSGEQGLQRVGRLVRESGGQELGGLFLCNAIEEK